MVAAVAAFGATAGPANAGTYDVSIPPCNSWSSFASNGWSGGIGCPGGYSAFQLQTGDAMTVGPPGTFMWLKSPRLPQATYLDSLTLSYASSQANASTGNIQARGCQRFIGPTDVWSGGPNGACVGAVFDLPNQPLLAHRLIGAGDLACGTNCGGWQLSATAGASSGFVWINGLTARIADNTAPTVTSQLASHTISQGNWMRGTVEIGATGVDSSGSGISAMAFMPGDPTLSVTTAGNCNFTQWIPCASSNGWTGAFDTTAVADGSHTGYYTATDPAGNTGQSASFAYKTDNTAPDTPAEIEAVTGGQDGWSSTNSFAASWINGQEVAEDATHSGLNQVIVDVNPTDGTQSDPSPVSVPVGGSAAGISATASGISGVIVPAAGAWTLRLQLVDKAGNASEVGDGEGASADSDVLIGFDPNPPAVPKGQSNGWISRDELAAGYDQVFTYTAPPTAQSPVCGFASSTDQNVDGTAGTTINVPGGETRKVRLDGTLVEATHYVHLRAVACNGLASPTSSTTEAKVDRTDPIGTIKGVESGKWYRDGVVVELSGADALSGMSAAPGTDGDATHGAYLAYDVNGIGPADDKAPRGDSASVPVSGEGEKSLRFSPVDTAGNKAAPEAIEFGVDATDPRGFIQPQLETRPTLLSAHVSDSPSGIAYAAFSVRVAGDADGSWTQLPTSLVETGEKIAESGIAHGVATARFPDATLSRGSYDVRISVIDQAGNLLTTQRREDGSPARVSSPMRTPTRASVQLFKALRTCGKKRCIVKECTKRSSGACYRVLKGKLVFEGGSSSVTTAYNRGAIAVGSLTDSDGNPVANALLDVTATETFSKRVRSIGSVRTDHNGIYALRVPPGVNRKVKVLYAGSELRREASAEAKLSSRAKLKLRISRKRVKTGQTVVFSGKITSLNGMLPTGGKIVALQFYAAKKWRPAVGVVHTDRKGNFKIRYKFDGARVRARIVFRVTAPSEDAWGHADSSSKPVTIRLN